MKTRGLAFFSGGHHEHLLLGPAVLRKRRIAFNCSAPNISDPVHTHAPPAAPTAPRGSARHSGGSACSFAAPLSFFMFLAASSPLPERTAGGGVRGDR